MSERLAREVYDRDSEAPEAGSGAGPAEGIDVVHNGDTHDVYGGRSEAGGTRGLNTAKPPESGWLGNPYRMDDRRDDDERRDVIGAYLADFLHRVDTDPTFRIAVRQIDGARVACWCRHADDERDPSCWCHLDVVNAWLTGNYDDLIVYLRGYDPRDGGLDQLRAEADR